MHKREEYKHPSRRYKSLNTTETGKIIVTRCKGNAGIVLKMLAKDSKYKICHYILTIVFFFLRAIAGQLNLEAFQLVILTLFFERLSLCVII